MSIARPEDLIITEIVGEFDVSCDLGGYDEDHCDRPARWVMHRIMCSCGAAGAALACDDCKDLRMTSDEGVYCSHCDEVYFPARTRYRHIEAL